MSHQASESPVVFITGCSKGLGLALAKKFHAEGPRLP